MTRTEKDVLDRLLSVDFEGSRELREQAAFILGVESSCSCGCPTVGLKVDRTKAPPATCSSPIPSELFELDRADGIPRTVICFLADGYLADLECVYYDDAVPEWPASDACALQVLSSERYVVAVTLPNGIEVRPHDAGEAWVQTNFTSSGLTATTWSGYRETFDQTGHLTERSVTK
jgi:hypothetical protein